MEMSPLLKGDSSSFDIDSEAQDGPVSIGDIPVEVAYTFTPRWPVKGVDREDVIGRLGKTQRATAFMVRRAFVLLADYPIDRIEFLAPIPYDGRAPTGGSGWAVVMEDAWDRFLLEPPRTLMVRLKDGSTDAAQRMEHASSQEMIGRYLSCLGTVLTAILICGVIIGALFAIWAIYHWFFY